MTATSWWLLIIGLIFIWSIIDRITNTFIICSYFKMIGKVSERVNENTVSNEFIGLVRDRKSIK